ncbi:MAG: bifunctional oligoribonuclease/PAP phosphatase NrnA [Clostridia bacterium]|nr:bifunctional oligoribonuclease/PAP phosphatase NrnA [Clostridia bacterium]
MNREITDAILAKIKEYDRIILMRHIRPDGDAVGSTMGLKDIIKTTWPEKEVYIQGDDRAEYLAFVEKEDEHLDDAAFSGALGIALDTATTERCAEKRYDLCKELIKIDHHIDEKPYGDLSWVEDDRSSTCEMIAAFYDAYRDALKMTADGAKCLYLGMVTDSGRFRFSSTSGETMRCAGLLLDFGFETEAMFANLYLKDYESIKYNAEVLKHMKMTDNGVAYLYLSRRLQRKLKMSSEDAGATISLIDSIKGSLIWIAFIETEDKSIRVRLRSRFVTVNELANRYHGGGHDRASGATCYSRREVRALIRDADNLLGDYKANNTGWL